MKNLKGGYKYMIDFNRNQKLAESILRGKARKDELSSQIDILSYEDFLDMIRDVNYDPIWSIEK